MYSYVATTIPGNNKIINEDRIFIDGHILSKGEYSGTKTGGFFAAVCDGVGGEHGGDHAASIVSSGFLPFKDEDVSADYIFHQLISINKSLIAEQEDYYYFRKMASTVAGMYFKDKSYYYFNLGDSRIYRYSGETLAQISTDHTLAEQMLTERMLSSIDDACKTEKNTVTRFLGGNAFESTPMIQVGHILAKDTFFIICSDGVSKAFDDSDHLKRILDAAQTIREKKEAVMQYALHNGPSDDKSLVIVSFH